MQPSGSERSVGDGPGESTELRGESAAPRWSPGLSLLLIALLAAAVFLGKMSAPGAIAAAFFGSAALFFAESLVRALERGERVSFESAWGGLGGGLGGWRLTPPLVYLVASAIFGALLLIVAMQEMPKLAPPAETTAEASGEAADAPPEKGADTEAERPVPAAEDRTGAQPAEDPDASEVDPSEDTGSDNEPPSTTDAAPAPAQPADQP